MFLARHTHRIAIWNDRGFISARRRGTSIRRLVNRKRRYFENNRRQIEAKARVANSLLATTYGTIQRRSRPTRRRSRCFKRPRNLANFAVVIWGLVALAYVVRLIVKLARLRLVKGIATCVPSEIPLPRRARFFRRIPRECRVR